MLGGVDKGYFGKCRFKSDRWTLRFNWSCPIRIFPHEVSKMNKKEYAKWSKKFKEVSDSIDWSNRPMQNTVEKNNRAFHHISFEDLHRPFDI